MAIEAKPLPSVEYLSECFWYDNESGELYWKERPEDHFPTTLITQSVNYRFAGKIAGWFKTNGYRYITLDGEDYKAHRLVWKIRYGKDPEGEIDHINGARSDNRYGNLRDCTKSQNQRNARVRGDSTTGYKGVSYKKGKKSKPYVARIRTPEERIHIGYYHTAEEAHAAICEEAEKMGDVFLRLG